MLLLTETVLFYWDCVDYGYQTSQQAAKGNFAGLSDVKDWVLASSKVLHSLPSQCASTHSRHARSASSSGTRVKAPRATPTSNCASTCASTGASTPIADSVASASEPQDFEPTDYLGGSDQAERKMMQGPSSKATVRKTDIVVRFSGPRSMLFLSIFYRTSLRSLVARSLVNGSYPLHLRPKRLSRRKWPIPDRLPVPPALASKVRNEEMKVRYVPFFASDTIIYIQVLTVELLQPDANESTAAPSKQSTKRRNEGQVCPVLWYHNVHTGINS